MREAVLGVVGIILTYVGVGLTLVGVGWGIHWQGKALANPEKQAHIGRQMQCWSWVWAIAGLFFLGIAVYLWIKLFVCS